MRQHISKCSKPDRVLALLAAGLLTLTMSCRTGAILSTSGLQNIDTAVEAASFSLILHSSAGRQYLDTVAILDIEGDDYEIETTAASYSFSVTESLTGEQALKTARWFLHYYARHNAIDQRAIMGPAKEVIGYELRPLYHSFVYGVSDVMDITYDHQTEGKVVVTVELLFNVEQQLRGGVWIR